MRKGLRFAVHPFGAVPDPVQLVYPESFVGFDPVVHRSKFLAAEGVQAVPAPLDGADEPRPAEDAEVFGDLGLRPAEQVDEPGDIPLAVAAGKSAEQLPSPWLGDGGEEIGSALRTGHGQIYSQVGICQAECREVGRGSISGGWRGPAGLPAVPERVDFAPSSTRRSESLTPCRFAAGSRESSGPCGGDPCRGPHGRQAVRSNRGTRTTAGISWRPKWRNRQTQRIQNPPPSKACGFESHLRHCSPER